MTDDSGCLDALATAIGHPAPFTDAEMAAVTSLTVRHARDLELLEACTRLVRLRLIGCDLADLLPLDGTSQLRALQVVATRLDSLAGLTFCAELERVDLIFTSLRDGDGLLALPHWRRGSLVGNPWSDAMAELLREERARPGMQIELSSDYHRDLCVRTWDRLGACFGSVGAAMLVRPGPPLHTSNDHDALRMDAPAVEEALGEPDLAALFAAEQNPTVVPDPGRVPLTVNRDAMGRMLPADRVAVGRLAEHVPGVRQHHAREETLHATALAYERRSGRGYDELREKLDRWSLMSGCPPVRFDRFDGAAPRSGAAVPYRLGLHDAGVAPGFAVVASAESGGSSLAVRLADDPRVFEYSEDEILALLPATADAIEDVIRPVFGSFAAMLDRVIGTVDRAQQERPDHGVPVWTDAQVALARFARRFPAAPVLPCSTGELDDVVDAFLRDLDTDRLELWTVVEDWSTLRNCCPVELSGFADWPPPSSVYDLGPRQHRADVRAALNAAGFLAVGRSTVRQSSMLAVRVGRADPRLFVYDEEDVEEALSSGLDAATCVRPVFGTFAEMLDLVAAVSDG